MSGYEARSWTDEAGLNPRDMTDVQIIQELRTLRAFVTAADEEAEAADPEAALNLPASGPAECPECDGTGRTECVCFDCDNEHERECETCKGDGEVESALVGPAADPRVTAARARVAALEARLFEMVTGKKVAA